MLEGRTEKLHCGSMCFAVYGSDDVMNDFVEYLKTSAITIEVRVIAGRDHLGRIKIVITGSIVGQLTIEAFMQPFIEHYSR